MLNIPINVKNLSFGYTAEKSILENISLTINHGEKVGLLGPTGIGKSTLMENLIGLQLPQKGEILIANLPVKKENLRAIRKIIGFAFQNPDDQLFMPNIFDDIMFGPNNYHIPIDLATKQANHLLEKFNLIPYANCSAYQLSGGQKRLAALAAILVLEPQILILDEPTNGLDPLWRKNLAEILNSLTIDALFISSHDLHWISKVTTRCLILYDGQIQVDLPTNELMENKALLADYGLPFDY
jgi:cobalt/nickel transport system ATP-binding protein